MNETNDTPQDILDLVKINFPLLYEIQTPYNITLLKYSENYIFLIDMESKKRIFRVNRPDYHTIGELNSEVVWMDMLRRETDLILPHVLAGKNKELIQSFYSESSGITYSCSLFTFMNGTIVKNLSGNELLEKMAGIGEITAKLHNQVILSNIELERFEWNYETLLGENPRFGDWRKYKGITSENLNLIEKSVLIIKNRLEKFGNSTNHYGLIHSDLHLSNIIIDGDILQIIDFDDCGYGWYLYDLGCSLVEYSEGLDELVEAWLNGYQKVRDLSDEEKSELPTFILMRRIVRLAWLSSHSDSDTAKSVGEDYLAKTIELSEKYLEENR